MEEKNLEIERKLDELMKRLDNMENQNSGGSFGRNVWVLVPIAAIIMWGLQRIL